LTALERGVDTYAILFNALKNYQISDEVFLNSIRIFDENVKTIEKIGDHNYKLHYQEQMEKVSDQEFVYLLSSGTTKGELLYVLMVASMQNGFDLIVDDMENHFHKTLVENMISLYKDKCVNKNKATLIFTIHYCEVLDCLTVGITSGLQRRIPRSISAICMRTMKFAQSYLKSRQFYNK
jgi:AAA15 family ATPase/GTPase